MSLVVCRLPKAGLGNHLFPLMNAMVFARLNNLPVIVVGYHHLKIGPYLRKEKSKRRYKGYFKFQKSILGEWIDKCRIKLRSRNKEVIKEHPVEKINSDSLKGKVFLYEILPRYHDYFIHLKPHRALVIDILNEIINPDILREVESKPAPVIGVHIRMGDFRKLKAGEDFSKVGHVRTPEFYFVDIINEIRKINGQVLPVSLFTDGFRHEFEQILSMDNIDMIEGNADIVDLLLLSKSRILVAANGSTFSYWAGFLANAPLIKHPDHLYAPFRPEAVNKTWYEGPMIHGNVDPLLHTNILALKS